MSDPIEALAAELSARLGERDARVSQDIEGFEVIGVLEKSRRRISVEVSDRHGRIPRNLSLRRSRGARRTTVGAPPFDQAVELSAPDPWALAVFDQRTRDLVRIMVDRRGATVEGGRIKHDFMAQRVPDDEVRRTLREAFDLARGLACDAARIPERLAQNAVEDPEPRVRERALTLLVEHHPTRAPVPCHVSLDDSDPAVRLVAASSLAHFFEWEAAVDSEAWAPEGRAAVEGALAELATTWGYEPQIRATAFDRFVEISETPLVVLERALADPVLAERSVRATPRVTDPSWLDLLMDIAEDCDETLLQAIAIEVADAGHPDAELLLLRVPAAPGVAKRLAEIGTARAVGVLRRVGTREAVAAAERIMARVGDLSGGMAIVDAERSDGALSEVQEGGRLSTVDED